MLGASLSFSHRRICMLIIGFSCDKCRSILCNNEWGLVWVISKVQCKSRLNGCPGRTMDIHIKLDNSFIAQLWVVFMSGRFGGRLVVGSANWCRPDREQIPVQTKLNVTVKHSSIPILFDILVCRFR